MEAFRLASSEARVYTRIEPRQGRFVSEVLGLELEVSEQRLRLWSGNALLLESGELLERAMERLEELAQRREG